MPEATGPHRAAIFPVESKLPPAGQMLAIATTSFRLLLVALLATCIACLLALPGAARAQMPSLSKVDAALGKNSAPATASSPAADGTAEASAPLSQSLDHVIRTLQNDNERRALVMQLEAMRSGLGATPPHAGAASDAAASEPAGQGLVGALAEAVEHIDDKFRNDRGPWQYWRWRLDFAAEEWRSTITRGGQQTIVDSLVDYATVLIAWGAGGALLYGLARQLRFRRFESSPTIRLPDTPSWLDLAFYLLRHIAPWAVAFVVAVLAARHYVDQSPAGVAGMITAYAIVAGSVVGAGCQVLFALFTTAHRAHAALYLRQRSRLLLFLTGALAALGDSCTDPRVIVHFGVNLSAFVSTTANIAAALMIGWFALRFRRHVGQLIALRPLAFRQTHPALVDLLRVCGSVWHLPVLAVVIASVIGTLFAAGHADELLRATVASVALFVAALALTMATARSPKAHKHPLRMRDRRRSAYLSRFGRFAVALLRVIIWIAAVEVAGRIWGVGLLSLMESTPLGRRIGDAVFSVIGTVLLAWLTWLLVDTAIMQSLSPGQGRAAAPSLRAKTILPLLRNAFFVTLLVVTLIVVLANLGVNVTPLLAGAGVVGLAIGFGAQSLVQDLITGLFIVIEDSIAIGDSIELPDHAGAVEAMTIRTVKLRDGKGALHILPYSQIKVVKNLSRGYAYAVFSISISYDSDLNQAMGLIRETGTEISRDFRYSRNLLSGLDILGLDRFDPAGAIVLAQFKTRPLTQAEITRAFNARLKQKFDEAGIRMTTPRMTVVMNPDAHGTPQPADIELIQPSRAASEASETGPPAAPTGPTGSSSGAAKPGRQG